MFYLRSRRISDRTADPDPIFFIIHERGQTNYFLTDYFGFSFDFCLEVALTFSSAIFDNFYRITNLLVNISNFIF